ncbi:MAG: DUF1501 domain-containing protein [Pirellulales bacterium]
MIRLFGNPKTLCDGIARRDLLHLGGLSLFGLNLAGFSKLAAAQPPANLGSSFGRAKSCILVYLVGAPPQHETFDPKPDAPAEIQGELKSISSAIPGVAIGEMLPRVAAIADRLTIVRSMTHAWPFHAINYALCGIPRINPTKESDPNDRTEWPFIGSVVDYLSHQQAPQVRPTVPRNVALPFPVYAHVNFPLLGGPYAGFLGQQYDPLWTSFDAPGTHEVPVLVEGSGKLDPFAGINLTDRFELGPRTTADSPTLARIGLRRALLEQFDSVRRDLETHDRISGFDQQQRVAFDLLSSGKLSQALDVQQESAPMREQYGMNLFGQSLLAARRVIEAGGKFVSVFWDTYGHFANGWDTHSNHYPRLKEFLLPVFDHSFPGFLQDMEARGLLDETLVLCLSEHGRSPRLNNRPGNGREHWSRTYSVCLTGAGIGRGQVVGESDTIGGEVKSNPLSPKDILASAFHLLGIDPHTMVTDPLGRPSPVAGSGIVHPELFG